MNEEKPVAIIGAITANLVIAVAKFGAAFVSGSSAMMAEGIHSVIDTGNEILLLVGIARSRRVADAEHPFGYGKELYFWSLVVAMLLFGVGGGMSVYEGVLAMWHPEPRGNPLWNYGVLTLALVAEGSSWFIAARALRRGAKPGTLWRTVRRSKDPTKFLVVGEDSAALAGLFVAFVGVATGQVTRSHLPDAIASVVIGAILFGTASYLVVETKALLIGESANAELVADIEKLIGAKEFVLSVGRPLTMHFGPHQVLVNLDLTVRTDATASELVANLDQLEAQVRIKHPEVKRIYISPQTAVALPSRQHRQRDGADHGDTEDSSTQRAM